MAAIVTDTCGFLVFVLIHAADIQDRDGAVDLLKAIRHHFPWLHHVFADDGYAGNKLILDRLVHNAHRLEISGESMRRHTTAIAA